MRVAVDARPAIAPRPTGVGVYCERLLHHLPAADPTSRYAAWFVRSADADAGALREVDGLEVVAAAPSRLPRPMAIRLGRPRAEVPADVMLATNFRPPRSGAGIPTVVVVHDLAFQRHPETAPLHVPPAWRRGFARDLAAAAAVIVPSEAVRSDVLELHGLAPATVHVIPHGVDAARMVPPEDIEAVRIRYGVTGPFALFIGGIEPRKNLEALVRAFGALRGDDRWLVIAGAGVEWAPDAVRRLDEVIATLPADVRSRVVRTGYVGPSEKAALLASATFLAYPSVAEGFGLPVLEAFAAGAPVLTSNVSSLPEVAGEAALLVTPEAEEIAAGLVRLFGDDHLRRDLAEAGRERARSFTWQRCAGATAAVLRSAAETGR